MTGVSGPESANEGRLTVRECRVIVAAALVCVVLRCAALTQRYMISKDGVLNVQVIAEFDSTRMWSAHPMPLYPLAAWAISKLTTLDWETGAHIAAILLAGLAVVPVYILGHLANGPRAAAWAAFLYAAHPGMIHHDTDIMAVSTCVLFFSWAVVAVWRGLSGSWKWTLAAPVFTVFALASRREAVILLPVIVITPLIVILSGWRAKDHKSILGALRFLGVLCFTGGAVLLLLRLTVPPVWDRLAQLPGAAIGAGERLATLSNRAGPIAPGALLAAYAVDLLHALTYLYLPLIVAGLVVAWRDREKRPVRFYLLGVALAGLVLPLVRAVPYGPEWLSTRYLLSTLSPLLVFGSLGCERLQALVASRWNQEAGRYAVAGLLVISAALGLRSPDRAQAGYRQAAEHIRDRYGKGQSIASARNQVAYYAHGIHVPLTRRAADLPPTRFLVVRPSSLIPPDYEADYLQKLGPLREVRQFPGGVVLFERVP